MFKKFLKNGNKKYWLKGIEILYWADKEGFTEMICKNWRSEKTKEISEGKILQTEE